MSLARAAPVGLRIAGRFRRVLARDVIDARMARNIIVGRGRASDCPSSASCGNLPGELTHEPKQLCAEPLRPDRSLDREPGEPKDGHGVTRLCRSRGGGQRFDVELSWSDRHKAEDSALPDRDVSHTEVMSELVLTGVLAEEAIENFIARVKRRTVIARPKCPNLERAAVDEGQP
jgi:hypothetical protein